MKQEQKTSSRMASSSDTAEQFKPVLEQVASALSHDVRTPLRHTHHFLDFFENGLDQPMSKDAAENFALIRQGIETSAQMVETLIGFARLDQRMNERKQLNLQDVVIEAMYRTRIGLEAPDASVSVTGQASVCGNEELLLSLFTHLFDNAVMYAPDERSPKLAVSITRIDADELKILIEDNGDGFYGNPEAAFRLFQKGGRKADRQGLGVGLSFARQIAQLHGGSLTVSDTEGELGGAILDLRLNTAP